MIEPGAIHYYAELVLWTAGFYLAGCPAGAVARRVYEDRRRWLSGGS